VTAVTNRSVPRDPSSSFTGWIGIARCDITPPVGIYARNWGASTHDRAEGVHRPLTATALTFQTVKDSQPAVVVSLDLGWWRSFKDERYVRDYILNELRLDSPRLMISLSHTHAGPVLCSEDRDKPGGEMLAGYLDFLRDRIVSTVREALANADIASLHWTYSSCSLACNRDLPDPDSDRVLCGYNPAGVADHTLLVGSIRFLRSGAAASILNYACHPTTLAWENRLISPDFVGAAREVVEEHFNGAPCMFLQGASGELAPRRQYTADTAVADANGRVLGYAVVSALENAKSNRLEFSGVIESGAPLAVWREVEEPQRSDIHCYQIDVELPLQSMSSMVELDAAIRECMDRVALERLTRKRRIREAVGDGGSTKMPAWIWRLGDSFLVGHPNEAYSMLQTSLRALFPSTTVAVMNVVNGHFGYLPPEEMYGKDMYPVWQSPFAAGSLERLIEACAERMAGM